MGEHANTYLMLFSHPFLVESLLRDFLSEQWVRHLDFSSLEKVASSFATDDLRSRHDDLVWRIRSRQDGQWIYLYLLLEFQRKDEYFMAVRVMTYVGLLHQDLIRKHGLKARDPLPLVLPIVLYNGPRRWKSPTNTADLVPPEAVPVGLEAFVPRVEYVLLDQGAFPAEELAAKPGPAARLFRMEHAGPEDLLAEVTRLRGLLAGPRHQELRRSFVIAILAILRRRLKKMRLPKIEELEEIETMIAEEAPTWTEMWEQQGLEKGLELGRREGWLLGRRKGREEGRQEGESTLLLRLLEKRFGSLDEPTRARVAAGDADRLLEWGDRILSAERLEDVFRD